MVKQVGAGMWTWLPLGWRVKKRVQEIIREEMDRIGGQEMLMSSCTRPSSGSAPGATILTSSSSCAIAKSATWYW